MKLKIKMLIITMAVMLIITSIIMYYMLEGAKMDEELIGFWTDATAAMGVGTVVIAFIKRKDLT